MGDEGVLTRREVLERQKRRLLDEVAVIDSQIAQIDQLAAQASLLGYSLTPVPGAATAPVEPEDLTIKALVQLYRTRPDSPYHLKKFNSRQSTNSLCNIVIGDLGPKRLADIHGNEILHFHQYARERARASGKGGDGSAIAEALVGQLRTLFNYGGKTLENSQCVRLSFLLRDLREQMGLKGIKPKTRPRLITASEAIAIRRKAHALRWPSIALAQAFLFDTPFLVRDIIGEFVPVDEKDQSEDENSKPIIFKRNDVWIRREDQKWIRGFRWENISPDGILRQSRSRGSKPIEFDLVKEDARMVQEELIMRFGSLAAIPSGGPMIVVDDHDSERPYKGNLFRHRWLEVAQAAGVDVNISNRHGYDTKGPTTASDEEDDDEQPADTVFMKEWSKAAE
jgi:hypothetical protein